MFSLIRAIAAFMLFTLSLPATAQTAYNAGAPVRDANPTPTKAMCWTGSAWAACSPTNAPSVATIGSRTFVIRGSFAYGFTSYPTNGMTIGGLVVVATNLPPGTIITSGVIRLKTPFSNITAGLNINMAIFEEIPTASTVTDHVALSIASADVPKTIFYNVAGSWAGATGGLYSSTTSLPRLIVDPSGNIYFSLIANSAHTFAGTGVLYFQIDGTY